MLLQNLRQLAIEWLKDHYEPNSSQSAERWYAEHWEDPTAANAETKTTHLDRISEYLGLYSEDVTRHQRPLWIVSSSPDKPRDATITYYEANTPQINPGNIPFLSKGGNASYYSPIFILKKPKSKNSPSSSILENSIKTWQALATNYTYLEQLTEWLDKLQTITLDETMVEDLQNSSKNMLEIMRDLILQQMTPSQSAWFAISLPDSPGTDSAQNVFPGKHPAFQEYYREYVLRDGHYTTKDSQPVSNLPCSLCGQVTTVYPTGVAKSGWNFFTQDHPSLFPQLNGGMHGTDWTQRFPICLPCAHALHIARTKLLPQFTLRDHQNNERELMTLNGKHIVWIPNQLPARAVSQGSEVANSEDSWTWNDFFDNETHELHQFFGNLPNNPHPLPIHRLTRVSQQLNGTPFSWTMLLLLTGVSKINAPQTIFSGVRHQTLYTLSHRLEQAQDAITSPFEPDSALRTPNNESVHGFQWFRWTNHFRPNSSKEAAARQEAQWMRQVGQPLIAFLLGQAPCPWEALHRQELTQWRICRTQSYGRETLLAWPNSKSLSDQSEQALPAWLIWQRWEWLYHTLTALQHTTSGGDFTMTLTPHHSRYTPSQACQDWFRERTGQDIPIESLVFQDSAMLALAFWTGVLAGKLDTMQFARKLHATTLDSWLRSSFTASTLVPLFNAIVTKLESYHPSLETLHVLAEASLCSIHIDADDRPDESRITHSFLIGLGLSRILLPSRTAASQSSSSQQPNPPSPPTASESSPSDTPDLGDSKSDSKAPPIAALPSIRQEPFF